jgi:hypothetical protein
VCLVTQMRSALAPRFTRILDAIVSKRDFSVGVAMIGLSILVETRSNTVLAAAPRGGYLTTDRPLQ